MNGSSTNRSIRHARRLRRTLHIFALLAAISLMLLGCKSGSESDGGGESSGASESGAGVGDESGGAERARPENTVPGASAAASAASAQVPDLTAATELLAIDRAALSQEVPVGNFATLTVFDERGVAEPLSVDSLEVEVVVEGRMARTQVTQVFRNNQPRQAEGTYEFTLPGNASISRLAMDVEGKMMEGELVERERAREIYESIVRRQKDPALLEWQGGDRFKTQIFPIPANGTKTVVLAYEQWLPESRAGSRYVYSLPKLSGENDARDIDVFKFTLTADRATGLQATGYDTNIGAAPDGASSQVTLAQQAFVPSGPLTVTLPPREQAAPQVRVASFTPAQTAEMAAANQGQAPAAERFFAVDLVPKVGDVTGNQAGGLVVAIDTSAGLGQAVIDQSRLAALMLVAAQPEGTPVRVIHGDFRATRCEPTEGSTVEATVACLKNLDAGGATDLEGLLQASLEAAQGLDGPVSVVLFSDGVASLGQLDGDVISGRVERAVAARPGLSMHTVAVGHAPAQATLERLASVGAGHSLRMTPSDAPDDVAGQLVERIHEPVLQDVTVELVDGQVEGLTPYRPQHLERGRAMTILGRLVSPTAKLKVTGRHGGEAFTQEIAVDAKAVEESALLRNFWARGWIETMHDRGDDTNKVVDFSLKYGVMSPYTSFLVLENDEAYRRFEVDRRKEAERIAAAEQEKATATETKNLEKSDQTLQEVLEEKKEARKAGGDAFGGDDGIAAGAPSATAAVEEEPMAELEGAPSPAPAADARSRPKKSIRADRAQKRKQRDIDLDDNAWDGESADEPWPGGAGGRGVTGERSRRWQPPEPIDHDAKITELTRTDLGELDPNVASELVWHFVEAGRTDDGVKFIQSWLEANEQRSAAERFQVANRMPHLTPQLGATATELARATLAAGPSFETQAMEMLLTSLGNELPLDELRTQIEVGRPLAADTMAIVLARLANAQREADGNALIADLRKTRGDGFVFDMLSDWRVSSSFAGERVLTLQALIKGQPPRLDLVDTLVSQLPPGDEGARKSTDTIVREVCLRGGATIDNCSRWFARIHPEDGGAAALAAVRDKRLENMDAIRAQDIGNPALIMEFASAMRARGETDKADRLLSEIVEFAPHAYGARLQYIGALRQAGAPLDVCREYAVAVQLDPNQRNHFRDMMSLRRESQVETKALRECIVQGVSNLPVNRAISLVLTWDDPEADIDLHIREPGDNHVFFQRKESPNGGLLYYDITDGFGPEIYVLGSAPKGSYPLSLVYYSKGKGKVTGTLTVLRNAGSRSETRQDFPFEITGPDTSIEMPITTLDM